MSGHETRVHICGGHGYRTDISVALVEVFGTERCVRISAKHPDRRDRVRTELQLTREQAAKLSTDLHAAVEEMDRDRAARERAG